MKWSLSPSEQERLASRKCSRRLEQPGLRQKAGIAWARSKESKLGLQKCEPGKVQ